MSNAPIMPVDGTLHLAEIEGSPRGPRFAPIRNNCDVAADKEDASVGLEIVAAWTRNGGQDSRDKKGLRARRYPGSIHRRKLIRYAELLAQIEIKPLRPMNMDDGCELFEGNSRSRPLIFICNCFESRAAREKGKQMGD
ncbi:hypothetical protein K0M31_010754 [Melipona bicolor]|uniref:Uncharacterized protein n=1 Tax=Melipona bicolor TaxID=60889 RepID=A0AA40FL25_9HYME|nr:hypothetical protein K0M31_010754 [Melipona bicolor]